MKFNGNLGPEKNQTHHERKNGKKIITSWQDHQQTPHSSESVKINPTIKQNEDKNRRNSINKMSQGTIRERNEKNVNNDKQKCLPFIFSIEFVVVVVSLVL